MQIIKRAKKGFTIVELVIVIAVIAILTAILVPTFISISNKADKASDESLKNYLNKALAIVENDRELNENGVNKTLHYAVEDLDNYGISLDKIVTKSDEKLVWKQADNRFYFESEVAASDRLGYWRIQTNGNDTDGYSIYAGRNFAAANGAVVVRVGFDAGYNKDINKIDFTYSDSAKRTVSIRTSSANTTLNITAPKGTVDHFGEVGQVNISSIDMDCFNEHGRAAYVKLEEGKVVAKDGGEIDVVFAANNDKDAVAVIKENGGQIDEAYTNIQPVSDTNEAREGGIPMTYSIDGQTAASMTEAQLEEALEETETTVVAPAATTAIDVMAEAEIEEDNKQGANYVARIGAKGYESLKTAIDEAKPGEKINLVADCELTESIGYLGQEGPNAGKVVDGLANEIVLSKDVALRLVGLIHINLMSTGKITMNGHTLRLGATATGAGIAWASIDQYLLTELEESTYYADLTVDIKHQSAGSVSSGNYIRFDGNRWMNSSMVIVSGGRMHGPISTNSTTYYDSTTLPRYNSDIKYKNYIAQEDPRPDDLWVNPFLSWELMDYAGSSISISWSVITTRGNLNLKVIDFADLDAYIADESNGFKALFESGNPKSDIIDTDNFIESDNLGFGSGIIDFVSGTGEATITATVTAFEIFDEDEFCGEEIEVGTTYEFSIFVF